MGLAVDWGRGFFKSRLKEAFLGYGKIKGLTDLHIAFLMAVTFFDVQNFDSDNLRSNCGFGHCRRSR